LLSKRTCYVIIIRKNLKKKIFFNKLNFVI
jgi:hypothetical protein